MKLSLRYDLRGPEFGACHERLYQACIEQAEWADRLGFSTIYLCEHHGAEDGYCPSPIVLASAIASRTRNVELHLSALVVTMHNPLRLAEDLAILDLISHGRVALTAGVGYRPHEFQMFEVDISRRVDILKEAIQVLEKAWTGEPFEYRGRTVRVTPRPTGDGPRIIMGGSTHASARRAAQMGYPFLPGHPAFYETYRDECVRLGLAEAPPLIQTHPNFLFVAEDPDEAWNIVGPHVLYATNSYAAWATERKAGATTYQPVESVEALKTMPIFQVLTPDECVDYALSLGEQANLGFQPLLGGIDPEVSWSSLHLFEQKVLPRLKQEGLVN